MIENCRLRRARSRSDSFLIVRVCIPQRAIYEAKFLIAEYIDAVKRSEEERIRQKHLKAEKKKQEMYDLLYSNCDDYFAFIAGYTGGGAAYGLTWEEVGIDPELPFEEKVRLYYEEME